MKLVIFALLFVVTIAVIWYIGPLPTSTEMVKGLIELVRRILSFESMES